jgi:translocation and assembly module TamA
MPILQPKLRLLCLLALGMLQLPMRAGAEIEVEVQGVEGAIRDNVLAYLSFERHKESEELTREFVERLQERSEREVRAAMRPFGYYEPVVVSDVREVDPQEYRVTISITPGKPVVVESVDVKVTGPGAAQKMFTDITGDLPIQRHDILNHALYEMLKGDLLRTAATYGYLDARMLRNEMRVDPRAHSAEVAIEFETGERYFFGATTITQDVIDESLARRFVRYKEGDEFNAGELLRTQFALDDSLYFSTVEVRPLDRDPTTHVVPVSITADPNRRHRYQYGVGYGTDTEVRGTASWEDRRVNRRGHRFRTEIRAAALEQALDSRYVIPIGDPAVEKFTLQLTGKHERLADVDDRSLNFTPSYTHLRRFDALFGDSWLGQQWWQRVTYVELLNTRSEFIASERRDTQTLLIPGISFSLVPDKYLGEALFSRALYLELRGSQNALGSDSDFLQVRVQAERVFDLARASRDDSGRVQRTPSKWHVLLRGDLGATTLSETSALAPSQRFFAGGDRSVRGFGVNDLSPLEPVFNDDGSPRLDENGNQEFEKVGGKHLFAASVELIRDLDVPKNFSLALFADVGNAFDAFGDPLMYSVGLGLRFRLPVVSVGLDVAQALTTPAGSANRPGPRLHLNFSPKL